MTAADKPAGVKGGVVSVCVDGVVVVVPTYSYAPMLGVEVLVLSSASYASPVYMPLLIAGDVDWRW